MVSCLSEIPAYRLLSTIEGNLYSAIYHSPLLDDNERKDCTLIERYCLEALGEYLIEKAVKKGLRKYREESTSPNRRIE